MTESILGSFEVSSANKINPKFFTLDTEYFNNERRQRTRKIGAQTRCLHHLGKGHIWKTRSKLEGRDWARSYRHLLCYCCKEISSWVHVAHFNPVPTSENHVELHVNFAVDLWKAGGNSSSVTLTSEHPKWHSGPIQQHFYQFSLCCTA